MRGSTTVLAGFSLALLVVFGCGFTEPAGDIYQKLAETQQQELDDHAITLEKLQETVTKNNDLILQADTQAKLLSSSHTEIDQKVAEQEARLQAQELKLLELEAKLATQPKSGKKVPETKARSVMAFMFVCESCVNCPGYQQAVETELKPLGWVVGPEEATHLRIVDTDKNPALKERWAITVWPTIVVADTTGKELGRITGVSDPKKLGPWLREFQVKFNKE